MQFGIFLPNGRNGYIISGGSPNYSPTFQHNKDISIEAERQGFDMVLSMMKYRGFGGPTGYWDECLETFTLMAGLAAATNRIQLFPSVTLLAHHPALAARMVATIDDISNGRCGLNIVTGWNKPEYEQMGLWRGDAYYNQRYDYAREYLGVLKALWRDGTITHRSQHFDLTDCSCLPRPKHEIPIVCAGQSPAGMRFAAEFGDRLFVTSSGDALAAVARQQKEAGARHGRQVGTFALFQLVAAETDAEAYAMTDRIVAGADSEAIGNMIASASMDTNPQGSSEHQREGLRRPAEQGNAAFMGMPVIHGSYRRVAAKLDEIAETTGIDGALFSFPDFVPGIRAFGEKVMPHLTAAKPRA
jgi:pyrimidine oxygenase